MKAALINALAAAFAATLLMVASLTLVPVRDELVLDVYVLVLGGLALLTVLAGLRQVDAPEPSPLDAPRATVEERQSQLPEVERIERILVLSRASEFDVHFRLRPLLREIVAARLARVGIDLDVNPRAREQVPPELWEVVRPDRELLDRYGRGLSRAQIRTLVDQLEAV